MSVVGAVIGLVLWLFLVLLIGRLVLDYVQLFARSWSPRGAVLVVAETVYSVTDPPVLALRRIIPPIRLGSINLDLSFMVLFFAILFLMGLNARLL